MSIRKLMLELSKFDGELDVMVATNKPPGLMQIDAVEETDAANEVHLVVLKCDGPGLW